MADRFYSVILGEHNLDQVTEGSATSSEAVELRVSDAIYTNKIDVILAVETLLNYLKSAKETSPIA